MTIALSVIVIGMLVCLVMLTHDVFTVRKMMLINNNHSIPSLRVWRRVGFTILVAAILELAFWAWCFIFYFGTLFFAIAGLISAILGWALLHFSRVILQRTEDELTKIQQ